MREQHPVPDDAMTPEPLEFDPFEMDWPWPGMVAEPTLEPARSETSRPVDDTTPENL